MRWVRSAAVTAVLAASLATAHSRVMAGQDGAPRLGRWHDTKCARYTAAWSAALERFGAQGLGRAFLDRHAAFLASNCTRPADVCPRSDQEFRLANAMVVLAMNAGTASTFPPFACRN